MPIRDDGDRQGVSEQLQALLYDLRPDDGPKGQAWVLSSAATFLAHVILAVSGGVDVDPVIEVAQAEIARLVRAEQSKDFRNKLRIVPK
jgi:hypothetical protein